VQPSFGSGIRQCYRYFSSVLILHLIKLPHLKLFIVIKENCGKKYIKIHMTRAILIATLLTHYMCMMWELTFFLRMGNT